MYCDMMSDVVIIFAISDRLNLMTLIISIAYGDAHSFCDNGSEFEMTRMIIIFAS